MSNALLELRELINNPNTVYDFNGHCGKYLKQSIEEFKSMTEIIIDTSLNNLKARRNYSLEECVSLYTDSIVCCACGARLKATYNNGVIVFKQVSITRPDLSDEQCPAKPYIDGAPFEANIYFPTGVLVFTNIFDVPDAPKRLEYTNGWSLNHLSGIANITSHLASRGYGYGQMGNMSVDIWVNNLRDQIIVTDGCLEDMINDDMMESQHTGHPLNAIQLNRKSELDSLKKDFKMMGSISLCVWRWMCADVATLGGEFTREENTDYVDVQVIPGTWKLTHQWTTQQPDVSGIASKLVLID